MQIPFKKDTMEFKQRSLFATNICDLLSSDHYCFVYEDSLRTSLIFRMDNLLPAMISSLSFCPRGIQAVIVIIQRYFTPLLGWTGIERNMQDDSVKNQ